MFPEQRLVHALAAISGVPVGHDEAHDNSALLAFSAHRWNVRPSGKPDEPGCDIRIHSRDQNLLNYHRLAKRRVRAVMLHSRPRICPRGAKLQPRKCPFVKVSLGEQMQMVDERALSNALACRISVSSGGALVDHARAKLNFPTEPQ